MQCSVPLSFGLLALGCATLVAQTPPDLAAERTAFGRWLETARNSPYAVIYQQPFEDRLLFGPSGDPALEQLPRATLEQRVFRLVLESESGERTVPRNRDIELGAWLLRVTGSRRRATVTVYGPLGEIEIPGWYAYDPAWVVDGVLEPPDRQESTRMLGLDGIEIEGSRAGTFVAERNGERLELLVYRQPEPGSEESDLNVFFRDGTNGHGTYPAGRFLALRPLGGNRYRADFNRTRNPFCAYNSIFPCPLPWRGNVIETPVTAGERYRPSGDPNTP